MQGKRTAPAGGGALSRPRFYWTLLLVMAAVEFVKGALLISVLPVHASRSLGMSAFVLGWAFALQFIGDNAFRIPAGRSIDRFGYRAPLSLGLAAAAAGVAALAWGQGALPLLLGCFLLGAGTSPLWPCAAAGATEDGRTGGTAFSGVYIASFAGTGTGPVLMGWLVKDHALRGPLWICLAVMAAAALLAATLPGGARRTGPAGKAAGKAAGRAAGSVALPAGGGWLVYPAMFLQTFAIGLLSPVVTLYVRDVLGWSAAMFTTLLIFGGGVALVLLPIAGRLADKAGAAPFLLPGAAAAAAATALFPYAESGTSLFAAVAAAAAGYALLIPSWKLQLSRIIPVEGRGSAWGAFLAVEGTGFVLGPVIGGWLWEHAGPGAPFLASGAALAVFFALLLPISFRKKVVVR